MPRTTMSAGTRPTPLTTNLERPADPLMLDELVHCRSGVDVDVRPEPAAVDRRSSALQLSKVADRAAAEKIDSTDLEKRTRLELKVVRHRLGRPVRLHLRDRHIAEHRTAVDAGFLISPRLVFEPRETTKMIMSRRYRNSFVRRVPELDTMHLLIFQ
jgi:hypothetical protein